MLKITFSSPIPYEERDKIIRGLKNLGLSYERIYQPSEYSLHRFYGRLPTFKENNVHLNFIDEKTKEDLEFFGTSQQIEIFLYIERAKL